MTIPDAAKLARYNDLAELVEELHDENMRMKVEIQRLNELLTEEQNSNIELEGELAHSGKHTRMDRIEFRDGSAEEICRDCGRHWKFGARGATAAELPNVKLRGRPLADGPA